ncbi:MAG: acyltransferase [Anaerolineaceae bacterium]|nr:acyltransferase [Anaerolineaceae bacterium]
MPFLSDQELKARRFKYLGKQVKISCLASIYNADQISIGDYSRIDDFCVLSGKITIGRNVHIAVFNNLAGGEKGITMDDFSGLAYGCHVFTQSDDYTGISLTNPTVPDQFKMEKKAAIHIKRHVIVGTNSLIFPGVILEEGCSVGALAMVVHDTEPWMIYTGVPAKAVKPRKKDLLELEKKYLEQE